MLPKSVESKIKKEAISYLKEGKENWDVPHTISAVKWLKLLIEKEGGDERVLIPATYFHDSGYYHIPSNYSVDVAKKAHLGHSARGSKIAKVVLSKLGGFSKKELDEIIRLINVHDKHPKPNDFNHQLIFEADGLAQIDWQNCKPTFNKEGSSKFFYEDFSKWRIPYVKTKTGRKYLQQLIKSAKKYLKDRS